MGDEWAGGRGRVLACMAVVVVVVVVVVTVVRELEGGLSRL